MKKIKEDESIIFGDIVAMAVITHEGEKVLHIYTDEGELTVRPRSGNSIRVHSNKEK